MEESFPSPLMQARQIVMWALRLASIREPHQSARSTAAPAPPHPRFHHALAAFKSLGYQTTAMWRPATAPRERRPDLLGSLPSFNA
jgi:hypothetical protein